MKRLDQEQRLVLLLRMHRKKQRPSVPMANVFVHETPSTPPVFERSAALAWPVAASSVTAVSSVMVSSVMVSSVTATSSVMAVSGQSSVAVSGQQETVLDAKGGCFGVEESANRKRLFGI